MMSGGSYIRQPQPVNDESKNIHRTFSACQGERVAKSVCFAADLTDVYKIGAESCRDESYLNHIIREAPGDL